MPDQLDLVLSAATYPDADAAQADFDVLRAAEDDDLAVVGAVVMNRDADGNVDVLRDGDGATAAGAVFGADVGLLVGLFAPPLLLSTAIGAGIGALLGHLVRRHEENDLGVALDEYLPSGTSAIVVVVDDRYLDRVERALANGVKRVSRAIDRDDYDELAKALSRSAP
jgi:uncharacterized membrane protein